MPRIWDYLQDWKAVKRKKLKKIKGGTRYFKRQMSRLKDQIKFLTKEEKIEKLRFIAEKNRFLFREQTYYSTRKHHKSNRAKYFEQWKICYVCNLNPVENIHHITMIVRGGTNEHYNLIGICKPCHEEIHPWLKAT